jgi:hypothetical protein
MDMVHSNQRSQDTSPARKTQKKLTYLSVPEENSLVFWGGMTGEEIRPDKNRPCGLAAHKAEKIFGCFNPGVYGIICPPFARFYSLPLGAGIAWW